MCDKLLSLCIATYNMENYLGRCLDSLTQPGVPETLEVLVINDGSKDKSLDIAKSYQEKRPDILRVIDKENGNYGSCVNKALSIATGKYFRMLDADDWFDTEALILFLSKLETVNADLLLTNYRMIKETGVRDYKADGYVLYEKEYNALQFDIEKEDLSMMFVMHSMTYKTSLLKKIGLSLQCGISYTDTEYCFFPIDKVESILFLNILLYQYDVSRDGQTMSIASRTKSIVHMVNITERLLSYFVEQKRKMKM